MDFDQRLSFTSGCCGSFPLPNLGHLTLRVTTSKIVTRAWAASPRVGTCSFSLQNLCKGHQNQYLTGHGLDWDLDLTGNYKVSCAHLGIDA